MELDITQKELSAVRDNQIDSLGNKIKLKFSSLANLVKHRVNVPYNISRGSETKTADFVLSQNNKFNLLPNDSFQIVNGDKRPINIKDKMLDNMRGKSNRVISITSEIEKPSISEPIVNPDNDNAINNDVSLAYPIENVNVGVVQKDISNFITEEDDINKIYQEVNNTRENLLNIQREVAIAENDANESERKVQELGVEFNETEKTLQEAEARRQAIQKKIIFELNNQLSTMNAEKQKFSEAIASANQRKEESENKIVDFQSRINDNRQKITAVNDDIARDEEKYHTLVGMSPINMDNEVEEQYVRKVA